MIEVMNPHTDKTRFMDISQDKFPVAHGGLDHRTMDFDENDPFVHTIEVSDERSNAHFITIFVRGLHKPADHYKKIQKIMETVDLMQHDTTIYHRDQRNVSWINTVFRGRRISDRWSDHYHWLFDHQPNSDDVNMVLDALDGAVAPTMRSCISKHYGQQRIAA